MAVRPSFPPIADEYETLKAKVAEAVENYDMVIVNAGPVQELKILRFMYFGIGGGSGTRVAIKRETGNIGDCQWKTGDRTSRDIRYPPISTLENFVIPAAAETGRT